MILVYLMAAYLVGSVPFGLLIARKVKGINIREFGSKNIGATNVFRVVGKKWGILVFLLDAVKGCTAVHLPSWTGSSFPVSILILLGITAILGHSFPIWIAFQGGKGVATSFGVFLALTPLPAFSSFVLFLFILFLGRILSLASLCAAVFFPLMIYFTYRASPDFAWYEGVSLLLAFFIFYTHRQNLRRLLRGEEKKLF